MVQTAKTAAHRQLDELLALAQREPVTLADCRLAVALADDLTSPLLAMLEALAHSADADLAAAGRECLVLHELGAKAFDALEARLG